MRFIPAAISFTFFWSLATHSQAALAAEAEKAANATANVTSASAISAAVPPANAAEAGKPAPAAPKEKSATLARIEDYLNSISTLSADFAQAAPDGSLTSGKFFLKRPGKMRWQYDPPTPLLMVASNNELVYYDFELEQVSHIPIGSTLAGFLARAKIDLSDPALNIDKLDSDSGVIRLSLSQRGKESEGKLMLEFSDSPLLIRNMVVTDAQGQITTVSLNNARFGLDLDNELFIFRDPRKPRRT